MNKIYTDPDYSKEMRLSVKVAINVGFQKKNQGD